MSTSPTWGDGGRPFTKEEPPAEEPSAVCETYGAPTIAIKTYADTSGWIAGWETMALPSGSTVERVGKWNWDLAIRSSLPGGLAQRTVGVLSRDGSGTWATTLAVRRVIADAAVGDFHGAEQTSRERYFRVRGNGTAAAEAGFTGWVPEFAPGFSRRKLLRLRVSAIHDGNRDALQGEDSVKAIAALRRHSGLELKGSNIEDVLAIALRVREGATCDCGATKNLRATCDRCDSAVCYTCVEAADCDVCERTSCRKCIAVRRCEDCETTFCQFCRDFHECPRCADAGCTVCRPVGTVCDYCRVPLI